MKKTIIAIALAALAIPSLAQVGADSQSHAGASATLGSVSTGVTINMPDAPAPQAIEYRGNYTVKNVPSVSGPNLTSGFDSCMGSTSGSANGPGVGLSFGTTWTDEHCKRLKTSRELWNKGMKAASLAVDCMDPAAKQALEITGTRCPQSMTVDERRKAFGPDASAEGAPVSAAPVVQPMPGVPAVAVRPNPWQAGG